jgi:hypothetical protein
MAAVAQWGGAHAEEMAATKRKVLTQALGSGLP